MITAFTRLKILSPTDSFIFVLWPAFFAVLFNSCPFILIPPFLENTDIAHFFSYKVSSNKYDKVDYGIE